MYLFIMTTILIHCMYNSCNALWLFETGAEFVEEGDVSKNNDSSFWKSILQEEHPVAILLELQPPLLEKIKNILENEKHDDAMFGQTTLATFDSMGLQEASFYNDTFEFRQAIMALQPSHQERETFSPAIHALTELLQKGLPQGSILLVTMSKPSDEDFVETLMRSLTENKGQLSVAWAGEKISDDYILLKDITTRTGGKFTFLQNDNENFLKSYLDNFSGSLKFPEDQNELSDEETPLVSRAAADQRAFQKVFVPLIVELASGATLELRPGTPTQVQFNVKNNLNTPTPILFNARYNGVRQTVQPPQTVLAPSATITVSVNILTGLAQNVNAVGTVTLLAIAANKVIARSALISMTPQTIKDNYAPKMTYKYEGDCASYKEPQNCENGHWSLQVTFHDEDSGILKILSEPYGLLFQNEFVAGTKQPVTVYYSATCCQPNAQIWAEDLRGNYVKKSFDVFNQNLLAGEIASIVLGILLVLFIVLAIIVIVIFIKKRNQRNLIIPRPRSGSR